MIIMLAATTIFGLALLAMPVTGLIRFPLSSVELLVRSMSGLPKQSARQGRVAMATQCPFRCCSTMTSTTTAPGPPPGGGRGGGRRGGGGLETLCGSSGKNTLLSAVIAGQPRGTGINRRAGAGVVIGRAGGGEGGLYDDDEEKTKKESVEEEEEEDQNIIITNNAGGGGGDDGKSSPAFSFAAIEKEILSRSTKTTTARKETTGQNSSGGVREEADEKQEEEQSAWLPRFFPAGDDGDGNGTQPLIELPLDGILLQLFPALLIGVVGTFLTIAVQFETSKFDGMVGEGGGAVIITDLRDTRRLDELP